MPTKQDLGTSYLLGPSPFYMGVFPRKLDLAGDISWGLRQDMQLKIQCLRLIKAGGMTNYWHKKTVRDGDLQWSSIPSRDWGSCHSVLAMLKK